MKNSRKLFLVMGLFFILFGAAACKKQHDVAKSSFAVSGERIELPLGVSLPSLAKWELIERSEPGKPGDSILLQRFRQGEEYILYWGRYSDDVGASKAELCVLGLSTDYMMAEADIALVDFKAIAKQKLAEEKRKLKNAKETSTGTVSLDIYATKIAGKNCIVQDMVGEGLTKERIRLLIYSVYMSSDVALQFEFKMHAEDLEMKGECERIMADVMFR